MLNCELQSLGEVTVSREQGDGDGMAQAMLLTKDVAHAHFVVQQ
jgi:hypothetical protein